MTLNRLTVYAQIIKIPNFDLGSSLRDDGTRRVEAEDAGESFEDDEFEFEEADESGCPLICPETSFPPSSSSVPFFSDALPSPSRLQQKKADKLAKSRQARRKNAFQRKAEYGLKGHVVRVAQSARPIELQNFSAAALPAAEAVRSTRSSPISLEHSFAKYTDTL
ncbi:hypothetical protein EV361DRAFT_1020786, partial [Lentinula raphanica]